MSFEPTLILRKKDLEKSISILEKEQYSGDDDIVRVAEYLLNVNTYETVKFDELELVVCQPRLPRFNSLVRDKLRELEIDFRLDN